MREVSKHWLLHTISTPLHAIGLSRNNFLCLSMSYRKQCLSCPLDVIQQYPDRFNGHANLYIKLVPDLLDEVFPVNIGGAISGAISDLIELLPKEAKKVVLGLGLDRVSFWIGDDELSTLVSNFPNLKFLNLKSCKINHMVLTRLNYLEELIIDTDNVDESLQKLNTVLLSWNSLKTLSLKYISKNLDCSFLKEIPSLEELNFSYSGFNKLEVLENLPNLKKINLRCLMASPLTKEQLLEFKRSHPGIEVLTDYDNEA